MERRMLGDFLGTPMMLKGKSNITTKDYLKLVRQVKEAALSDMDSFPENEGVINGYVGNSVLGVKLKYRDDEDCLYADSSFEYQLFSRLHPYLMEYIRDGAEQIIGDTDLFKDSVENKFYWIISKFIQIQNKLYEQYRVLLSLSGNIIGVEGDTVEFNRLIYRFPECLDCFSEKQKFILDNMEQITSPLNVLLSYQPGDILYIDANPLGKPFYTVYCAETSMTQDYFDWTIKEYGHYKREHPCLYVSEDHKGIDFTDLTGYVSSFTDYIHFPYSPLDRIKVVETCENPVLLKASRMLKENPAVFLKWRDWKESHGIGNNDKLGKYILNDEEK